MSEISIKIGTAAITRNFVSAGSDATNRLDGFSDSYFTGTVIDVLLLSSQRESFFKDLKENSSLPLGTIKVQRTFSPVKDLNLYFYAIPMSQHVGIFPRVGEMVKVSYDNTYDAQSTKGTFIRVYYYFEVISAWSSVEHNIVPNLALNNVSTQQGVPNYQKSEIGVPQTSQTGTSFNIKEKGDVKNLIPLSDNILQGRGGNSIRLGTSDSSLKEIPWKGDFGNPVLILRNGQRKTTVDTPDQIFEDINSDGSSIYFLSGQTIDFIASCTNFDSYATNVQNPPDIVEPKKDKPLQTVSNNQEPVQANFDPPTTTFPVSTASSAISSSVTQSYAEELEDIPNSEDEIFYIGNNISVPLTNGTLLGLGSVKPEVETWKTGANSATTRNSGKVINDDSATVTDFLKYSGLISSQTGLSISARAFLDLIAITEGTIGRGSFNGYDKYFGTNKKITNYNSDITSPVHPNDEVPYDKSGSTAAGRYQFLYDTWLTVNGNVNLPMSKNNQDKAGYKLLLERVSSSNIEKAATDFETFKLVVGGQPKTFTYTDRNTGKTVTIADPKCLAGCWASLPSAYVSPSGKFGLAGCYDQNKENQRSFESLWRLYQDILKKYNGVTKKTAVLALGTNDVGSVINTYANVIELINYIKTKGFTNIIVVPPTSKGEFKIVSDAVLGAAKKAGATIVYGEYEEKDPDRKRSTGYHLLPKSSTAIRNTYKADKYIGDSNSARIANYVNGSDTCLIGKNTNEILKQIKAVI